MPMPWQRHVAQVACEIDPRTGKYWYREVIIVVPRQAGKTSLSRGKVSHRCLTDPRSSVLYTAQDRIMSLRRLKKSFYEPLDNSPFAPYLGNPRWTNGSETVRFRNKSEIVIAAPGKKTSIHGDTLPEAHIDEAFAHADARIEQAVGPTMITVIGAQTWVTSAAGDSDSKFLWGKVEAGRARVEAGLPSRIAYFEFSAPEDADRDDPLVIAACHPAVGFTIELELIMAEKDRMDTSGPVEFNRAYLGWWPRADEKPWAIPKGAWKQCLSTEEEIEWDGVPMWSIDVSPERDWTSVGMAAEHVTGNCFLELVAREQGTDWVVRHLKKLRETFGGNQVVIDGSGPAGSLEQDLVDENFEVIRLGRQERADACGALFDAALAETIVHSGVPEVDDALAAAEKRYSGDAFIWGRRQSEDDITALYALTLVRAGWVSHRAPNYDPLDSVPGATSNAEE
ncbi:hypothetical protein FB461_1954 [Rarobacter faecitabidus]|uniref:Phage terminase large subunit-like protein n=1 Tax=Rarobacter faecitabidus TaxID=13243 RepID=A0A542ZE24_RARFA|nr:hypothetical protein FB461_1954 [Rarobacter faecitabidus]